MKPDLEEIVVCIASDEGDVFEAKLYINPETSAELYFESDRHSLKEFVSDDLFDCMIKLRDWLDYFSLKPLCNGARVDVYPSAMSRQMSGGRLAYKHQLKRQCSRADLVDIFQPASSEMLATTAEQKEFHEKWMKSL